MPTPGAKLYRHRDRHQQRPHQTGQAIRNRTAAWPQLDTGAAFTVGSYTYELPFGKGKKFNGQAVRLGERADRRLASVDGITTYSLGIPFGVTEPTTTPNVDALYVLANRTCDRNAATRPADATRILQHQLLLRFQRRERSAIRRATYGTVPGINNWDVSFFKNFPLGAERRNLQFRAEGFNLFNHTQFNNPTSSLPNATFGQILSAKAPADIFNWHYG